MTKKDLWPSSYQALLAPPLFLGRVAKRLKGPNSAKVIKMVLLMVDGLLKHHLCHCCHHLASFQVVAILAFTLVILFLGLLLADAQVD